MLTRRGDVSYCGSCLEIHYHLGRISRHFAWEMIRHFAARVSESSIRLVTCTIFPFKPSPLISVDFLPGLRQ